MQSPDGDPAAKHPGIEFLRSSAAIDDAHRTHFVDHISAHFNLKHLLFEIFETKILDVNLHLVKIETINHPLRTR